MNEIKIYVCLPSFLFLLAGNICRSPIAEAVFAKEVKERGLSDQVSSEKILILRITYFIHTRIFLFVCLL